MRKPLPNALDIDLAGGLTEEVTPPAGVALLIELGRRSGVMAAAGKDLPPKKAAKGTIRAVAAAAGPLLDPPGVWPRFHGFRVGGIFPSKGM